MRSAASPFGACIEDQQLHDIVPPDLCRILEKQRFRFFISKVEPVALCKLHGGLPFRFRTVSVKENAQQFSLRVAPYMMGLAAPPGKKGEGYPNSAVQNSLDAGAVAAVAQTADNDQRVAPARSMRPHASRSRPITQNPVFFSQHAKQPRHGA